MSQKARSIQSQIKTHFEKDPKRDGENVKLTIQELNEKDIAFLHNLNQSENCKMQIKRSGTGLTIIADTR